MSVFSYCKGLHSAYVNVVTNRIEDARGQSVLRKLLACAALPHHDVPDALACVEREYAAAPGLVAIIRALREECVPPCSGLISCFPVHWEYERGLEAFYLNVHKQCEPYHRLSLWQTISECIVGLNLVGSASLFVLQFSNALVLFQML